MIELVKGRVAMIGGTVTALLIGSFVMAGSASASSDPVSDAFTTLNGKVTTYGGALVALVVLAVGIVYGITWINKARRAA